MAGSILTPDIALLADQPRIVEAEEGDPRQGSLGARP
jgi:hypothetical protein